MLLYLSLILCLLQNMYQADWHGSVDTCISSIAAADETQVRQCHNPAIDIKIAIPESILRTGGVETLVTREQCLCP